MLNFTKKYHTHPLIGQLRDVQSLGLIVFAVIVVLVSWSGVKAIQANYKLEKQVQALRQENDVQALQNNNQKLRNDYYKTSQYLELAARQNFGLAAPGEKVLLVPKAIALAHVQNVPNIDSGASLAADQTSQQADKKLPFYQRNMQSWINFFLHRTGS